VAGGGGCVFVMARMRIGWLVMFGPRVPGAVVMDTVIFLVPHVGTGDKCAGLINRFHMAGVDDHGGQVPVTKMAGRDKNIVAG